jgi:Zn-dependent alcohol dehydrogenase
MVRGWTVVVLVCASAMGCSTGLTAAGERVATADEQMVKGCKYLGDVHAVARLSNVSDRMEDARRDARNQAAQLGATHILFASEDARAAETLGRAYQCPPR